MFYLRLFIFIFLAGCATKKPNEYQRWVSIPTPKLWNETPAWSVLLLDKNGAIVRNLIVKFIQETAESCSSGDFKKIQIVSEYPRRSELFIGKPAYYLKGSALIIDLSANLCGAGYELKGQVSEIGIEGYHQPASTFGGEVAGRFYAVPLTSSF